MSSPAEDFEVIIFPGKNPPQKYLRQYNQAYQCWRESWEDAFAHEMENDSPLYSDAFSRQDEVLALFYKNKCAAVVCFRTVDFSENSTRDDSYFEHWPPFSIHKLCQHGKKILILSQFAISLDHRRHLSGINPRDLIVGLCYEFFLHSDCDAGASAVRIQKNMGRAAYSVGATPILKNAAYSYGQRVDLIAYFWDQIHTSNVPGIAELSGKLIANARSLVKPIGPIKTQRLKMLLNLKQSLSRVAELAEKYPWHDPYAYGLYLAQTYYYVSHSTQLLALAAGIMKTPDTPFHRRFLEHAAEEKGHELMLLNDLKKLGFELTDFPELPETRMFWEPQFYKIQHNDPLSVMGYIVALEVLASEQCHKVKSVLEKNHPEGSYTFIRVHGEEDPDHVEKALQVIASLPSERRRWIEENFTQSVCSFQNLITRMMKELEKKEKSLKVA